MKKLILVLVVVTTTVSLSGCQNCLFRRRGARCRTSTPPPAAPAAAYPSTTCSPPATCAPATTCSPAMTSSASVYSSPTSAMCVPQGIQSEPVVVQEFPTSPIIESDNQVVNRPIVSNGTTYLGGNGSTTTIPGPEMAPPPNGN